jgi:cell division inhibitor SulA
MHNLQTHPEVQSLAFLHSRPDLWRGRLTQPLVETQETGFEALDRALHNNGWPTSGAVELLCESPCPQALRLLLPVLSRRQDGLIAMANPPARPQAHTLHQAGIHSANLLIMRSTDPKTLLRACRETAASGAASALLAWLPEGSDSPANLRRLHMAAKQGRCLVVVLRHARHAVNASPAPLRLLLQGSRAAQVSVEIIKQPGAWGGQTVSIPLSPERIHSPLADTTQMPVPTSMATQRQPKRMDSNQGSHLALDKSVPAKTFTDPDSRFAYRPKVASPHYQAIRSSSLTRNLSLPL